jgi:hypothetical protein
MGREAAEYSVPEYAIYAIFETTNGAGSSRGAGLAARVPMHSGPWARVARVGRVGARGLTRTLAALRSPAAAHASGARFRCSARQRRTLQVQRTPAAHASGAAHAATPFRVAQQPGASPQLGQAQSGPNGTPFTKAMNTELIRVIQQDQ